MYFAPNPGILAAGNGVAGGQQLFTSSGTFVVPVGVTSICVVAIGRGGDGAGASTGAGGGLAYANNVVVSPGESITITVNSMESTAFGSVTIVRSDAGIGTTAGSGTVGDVLRAGGAGQVTFSNIVGASAAGYTSNGNASASISGITGGAGTSPLGGGGAGPAGGNSNANGGAYGGGAAYGAGNIGGPGCVRIIWGAGRAFPNTNAGDV